MIKIMAAVTRRPGMTHAEYTAYVQHVHGSITKENPLALARYVQNHVFDAAFGTAAQAVHTMPLARDSITELSWDGPEDMIATFQHDHVRTRVAPDGRNFSALDLAANVVVTDVEQAVLRPRSHGGAKVMHFLWAAEGLPLATFFQRWADAHAKVLREAPEAAAAIGRCVHHRQLPQFAPMLAHFGSRETHHFEGVASLWFDSIQTVGAFRQYEAALLEINRDPDRCFYRPEQSFFVYATEVPIYERSVTSGR